MTAVWAESLNFLMLAIGFYAEKSIQVWLRQFHESMLKQLFWNEK